MKAADVYRVLNEDLGPTMLDLGFKRKRASRLAYQRSRGAAYHTVWFQCDHWGWDQHSGSKFFVNFTVSPSPDLEPVVRRTERLNFFLSDDELLRARALRNAVVGRIPPPPESFFDMLAAGFKGSPDAAGIVATARAQFEPQTTPYRQDQDFGLRYWQPRDLTAWAEFMAPVLPRAIAQMESWTL